MFAGGPGFTIKILYGHSPSLILAIRIANFQVPGSDNFRIALLFTKHDSNDRSPGYKT